MQQINAPDLRKYRIELPNLYDDADLDPYEFRLLAHYVRRGECWEKVRTTADCCKMSHPTVIRKRESLEEKGWIKTWQGVDDKTIHVKVVDKWPENYRIYSGTEIERLGTQVERLGTEVERLGTEVELKNIPIKNKEERDFSDVRAEWEKYQPITQIVYDDLMWFIGMWDAHAAELPQEHPDKGRGGAAVVIEAIQEMMRNIERPNANYAKKIIEGWITRGYKVDTRKKTQVKTTTGKRSRDGSVFG